MKKLRKVLSVVLSLLIVTSLCSCGKKDNQTFAGGEGTDQFVNLVMYLIGEKPNDYDKVVAKLNEMLKEDINASLEVRWMSWGDYAKKYPVLMSSGEPFDLIYSVDWINYSGYSQQGAFLDITDLLPKYAPKSYKALAPELLDRCRVNGRLYALPANAIEVNPGGYVVRGDLMDKYGMKSIDSFDDFMDYLKAVKENESIMPINASTSDNLFEFKWGTIGVGAIAYDYGIGDYETLFYTYEKDEYKHVLERMREGYLNGYWSKDVLMNKLSSKEAFINGTSAAATSNLKNFSDLLTKVKNINPSYDPRWYPKAGDMKGALKVGGASMSVSASSKNPERAIMLLELLNSDKRYYYLTTYGIEGVHYVIDKDGKYEFPEGVTMETTGFSPNLAGNWGWNNDNLDLELGYAWSGEKEIKQEVLKNGQWSKYLGFNFDNSKVQNELAAVSAASSQYQLPLTWGIVDTEEGLDTLIKQYKLAGIEKIMEEAKRQTKEFLDSKK